MVKLLHIETATKVCSVALSENGELVEVLEESSDQYIHAERLTVLIEQLMTQRKLLFSDLSAISVSSGPGSYTGLRIGVSTAKGICYAANLPLISIGALDALIADARLKHPKENICAMIDARRMEVFSKIVSANNEIIKPLSGDELDEQTYADFEPFIAVGDAVEKCTSIWNSRNVILETKHKSSAKGQVRTAFEKFNNADFENVAYFEPLYFKDFVATKSKKRVF